MTRWERFWKAWHAYWRIPGQCPECRGWFVDGWCLTVDRYNAAGQFTGRMYTGEMRNICPVGHKWRENIRGEVVEDGQDDKGRQGLQGEQGRQKVLSTDRWNEVELAEFRRKFGRKDTP